MTCPQGNYRASRPFARPQSRERKNARLTIYSHVLSRGGETCPHAHQLIEGGKMVLEDWMHRNFNQNIHERIAAWVKARTTPFDHEDIAKANHCTEGYARSAMLRYFAGRIRYHRKHVGSSNFRLTYFPLDWDEDQCRAWMDAQVKSGKSRAKLYLLK